MSDMDQRAIIDAVIKTAGDGVAVLDSAGLALEV
eukprot:COSAG02_NODE_85923_length_100_cov_196.000000_1_plen_33_part_11